MTSATMILAILFLIGFDVGEALAICAIITGILQIIVDISKIILKRMDK